MRGPGLPSLSVLGERGYAQATLRHGAGRRGGW